MTAMKQSAECRFVTDKNARGPSIRNPKSTIRNRQRSDAKILAGWMEKYLKHLEYERNVSPHTLRNYASDLEQFYICLTRAEDGSERAEPELGQIDNITIREFLGQLHERGNKKSSVARKLATVRSFMKFLRAESAITANPAKLVATPRQEKRLPDF